MNSTVYEDGDEFGSDEMFWAFEDEAYDSERELGEEAAIEAELDFVDFLIALERYVEALNVGDEE